MPLCIWSIKTNHDMTSSEIRNVGDLLQAKWHWFLALGVVLIACGAFAVLLPSMSGAAASVVLGIVLAVSGVVKIIEALQVRDWTGALWQLLLGCVEVVGGVLIYLNPLKGVLAITTLIAVVFLVQGSCRSCWHSGCIPRRDGAGCSRLG